MIWSGDGSGQGMDLVRIWSGSGQDRIWSELDWIWSGLDWIWSGLDLIGSGQDWIWSGLDLVRIGSGQVGDTHGAIYSFFLFL